MKKTIIVGLVMVLAVLGVAIAIKYSNSSTDVGQKQETQIEEETGNPASEIGEGEVRFTEENFQNEVRDYKGVVMVDFYLPSCSHCKALGPVISEIAKETQGKYKIGKINAQIASTLTGEFQIEAVPAMIFFKDGKEVSRLVGEKEKAEILAKLEEAAK